MRITKYKTKYNRETGKPELVKEKAVNLKDFIDLCRPERIVHMMNEVFDLQNETEEYLYMLVFDSKMNCKGVFEVSHGTGQGTYVDPRAIFMKALLGGAVSIVLVHNHPSGDTNPSKEDIETTKRIKAAGKLLNVPLLDHIIIGSGTYFSLREAKLM